MSPWYLHPICICLIFWVAYVAAWTLNVWWRWEYACVSLSTVGDAVVVGSSFSLLPVGCCGPSRWVYWNKVGGVVKKYGDPTPQCLRSLSYSLEKDTEQIIPRLTNRRRISLLHSDACKQFFYLFLIIDTVTECINFIRNFFKFY